MTKTRVNGAVAELVSRVFRSTTTPATSLTAPLRLSSSSSLSLSMSGTRTRKFSGDEKAHLLANLDLEGQEPNLPSSAMREQPTDCVALMRRHQQWHIRRANSRIGL